MQLAGRLRATTLGDVLGALHRARAHGVLELVETSGPSAGRKHRIHLTAGQVASVDASSSDVPLGELLRRRGLLDASGHRKLVLRLAQHPGRRAGDLLVEERLIAPDVLGAVLRHQLRARLDALFRLPDATVSFHVARTPVATADPLPVREYLAGRPRARDRAEAPARPSTAPAPRREGPRERALSTLGLPDSAGRDDVTRAFRRLARDAHPDRFPQASDAERRALVARFAAITAAYHALVG